MDTYMAFKNGLIGGLGGALFGGALLLANSYQPPASSDNTIPDPLLTPGAIASTDIQDVCSVVDGLSYSKRHRITPPELKRAVRIAYNQKQCGEIDHRVPLALGGADTFENLWCQPGPPTVWNYKIKDRLETHVWVGTCGWIYMYELKDAQQIFLNPDWRVEYCKAFQDLALCDSNGKPITFQ